jgi:hypothetical protein
MVTTECPKCGNLWKREEYTQAIELFPVVLASAMCPQCSLALPSRLLHRSLKQLFNGDQTTMTALQLIDYLISVAEKTEGAEVWRALFAEIRKNLGGH